MTLLPPRALLILDPRLITQVAEVSATIDLVVGLNKKKTYARGSDVIDTFDWALGTPPNVTAKYRVFNCVYCTCVAWTDVYVTVI